MNEQAVDGSGDRVGMDGATYGERGVTTRSNTNAPARHGRAARMLHAPRVPRDQRMRKWPPMPTLTAGA